MDDIKHSCSLYIEAKAGKDEVGAQVDLIGANAGLGKGLYLDLSKNFSFDERSVGDPQSDFIDRSPYMLGVAAYSDQNIDEDEMVRRIANIVRYLRGLGWTVVAACHLEDRIEAEVG